MSKDLTRKRKRSKNFRNLIIFSLVIILIVGVPLLVLTYQARKSGMSVREVIQRKMVIRDGEQREGVSDSSRALEGEKIVFLDRESIGLTFTETPMISHLVPHDLDDDGLLDVIVCDARDNFVSWIRQYPAGVYTEEILAEELIAPAHVQVFDFDQDGDKDLLVAVLGLLFPSNDRIGSVVVLENEGNFRYKKHVIVERIARVSDLRAGDLDGDGDMDLVAAQFGYDDGETRWIENMGEWKFRSHMLQSLSGPINVEIVDIDYDGDMDIISLVSQEWEEIYCFLNDGTGEFQVKLLWGSENSDFGSSGISLHDLNLDGKLDILFANGDAFDYIPPKGRPWHGVQWFENKGDLNFEYHRLCNFIGAYSLRPADVDRDGDLDLFAVSAFNLWENPEAQSFIWLENIGDMQFIKRNITNSPTHLIIVEPGDFNNDGLPDFVTAGMHPYPPFDRMSRISLWINDGSLAGRR